VSDRCCDVVVGGLWGAVVIVGSTMDVVWGGAGKDSDSPGEVRT
jgi:hypothetical protein